MYEKILAAIGTAVIVLVVIWFVCRRDTDRRTGSGTGTNDRRIRDDIDRAGKDAERAADLNQRATDDNQRAQDLVQKAKSILGSAKHTNQPIQWRSRSPNWNIGFLMTVREIATVTIIL